MADGTDESDRLDDVARALDALRRMIDAGRLPADGRLPTERELAAELDVGRRAVRRALERLGAEGLVWRRQGKGTFVGQPPDPAALMAAHAAPEADPLSVMEARLVIEPGLAALCARRADAEDVARLRDLAARTAQAADTSQVELWDGALHRLIARIAGNPVLLTAFAFLDEVRRGVGWQETRLRARNPDALALYEAHHAEIVDAIAARDGDRAEQAMRAHLSALRDRMQAAAA
ncbi:FadR/GntR family transcriptional regulator [uncultured Jannaschia sp.]|uniref:FadR/GntR family transcriptional regulator n=1 Tax=uncultured Jannaschia sp. TaxID=293347 RepID=UPI00262D8159|nr:FadR/GntR family transcriptional regulator [uncultured Jannaschia sp.]